MRFMLGILSVSTALYSVQSTVLQRAAIPGAACNNGLGGSGTCQYSGSLGCPLYGALWSSPTCFGPVLLCCVVERYGWPDCQKKLECTFRAITTAPLVERISYIRSMQDLYLAKYNAATQFRAVEGVIQFFLNNNLGGYGTWISDVDAAIVKAIQDGVAIARGNSAISSDIYNANQLWAQFLWKMKRGEFRTRNQHDFAWASAEEAATNFGVSIANTKQLATQREKDWFSYTQIFRYVLMHRDLVDANIVRTFKKLPKADVKKIMDWFTDTSNPLPGVCATEAAWGLAGYTSGIDVATTLLVVPKIVECAIKYGVTS